MCLVHFMENVNAAPEYDAICLESCYLLPHLELQHHLNLSAQMCVDHWKERSEEDDMLLIVNDATRKKTDGYILNHKSESLSKFKE